MFAQLLSGIASGWLEVAVLVTLLGVLIFKPERIQRPKYYWKACILFVICIVFPSIISLFAGGQDPETYLFSSPNFLIRLLAIIPPAALAGSILITVYCLIPASEWTLFRESEGEGSEREQGASSEPNPKA